MHKNSVGSASTLETVPVRELHSGHKEEILHHLLLLSDEDRRLRFGTQTPDEVISCYVEKMEFNQDAVFASFDAQLNLIGLAHLAYLPKTKGSVSAAEFGVSVLRHGRGQGVGTALLARAAMHSRNTNIQKLHVHCLANNKAMMRLAHKVGMKIAYAYGDADAYLLLPPANSGTLAQEAANEQWGGFDYALKKNVRHSNALWQWLLGRRNKTV